MPASNPLDSLSKIFGLNKSTIQSVVPSFPYQTAPPKPQSPSLMQPPSMGMPPGLGQTPLSGDPTKGLVGKDSDLMMQGLMQMMSGMGGMGGGPPPPTDASAPPPEGGSLTGGEFNIPPEDIEETPEQATQELTQMRGEDQPATQMPPQTAAALREPVPYIPARARRRG